MSPRRTANTFNFSIHTFSDCSGIVIKLDIKDDTFELQKKQPSSKGGRRKKQVIKFTLDCTHPVEDGILDAANFVSRSAAYAMLSMQ